MSIFKDTFRPYVRDQLALREEIIALGNREDSGIRLNRNSPQPVVLHGENKSLNNKNVNLSQGAFYNYTLNKQCIIRMTSMVDYVENVNLEVGGLEGENNFNAYRGAALSQNFILEGGTLSDYAIARGGNRETIRVDRIRDSFPRRGLKTNTAYGDMAIGADASSDGFGIVPMPGITDINVRTKSAYGSLREAKVNFECHNRRQLEVLEMLYMRPGYMVILEWGWNPYIKNDGTLYKERRLLEDYFTDTGYSDGKNSRIYTNNITQQEIFNAVNVLKEFHNGNYDGFLGFVKNFGFQAREDGGYTCYTELVSVGEIIDSLRIPNISITDPIINLKGGTEATDGEKTNITVASKPTPTSGLIGSIEYNEALNAGLFPRYNGLLGLAKSLYNYCTFGSFSSKTRGVTEFEQQRLEEVFQFENDEYVDSFEKDSKQRKQLETQKTNAKQIASTSGYKNFSGSGGNKFPAFLRDLMRYQSTTIEDFLITNLGLSSKGDLVNYIIPITQDEPKYSTDNFKGKVNYLNTQPFIRWDALCILINENLITKDSKAQTPVKIVTDRIYDTGGGKTLKVDPLLFCPISDYTKSGENELLDYSCDANVCILPMQFETNVLASQGGNIDAFGIKDSIGYMPQLSDFPLSYLLGSYGSITDQQIDLIYRDQKLVLPAVANDLDFKFPLNDTDRLRRIGSIFLNVNMINDIAEKHAGEEDYTLGKFINDIWKEVNKVCPNHNFVVTDDKESNTVFVIDLPVDSSEVPSELYEFIPFSNKNILREFSYTSNVPKAMSATVAIQAQDPRSIQDIDGVTFAAFNRSIKNRILSTDDRSDFDRTVELVTQEKNSIQTKQQQLRGQMDRYVLRFFSNLKLLANDKTPISEGNIVGITKEYQKNATYISQAVHKVSTFTSVIPLEFNATLDGISGIVIGNIFKIQKDRLPKAYQNTRIGFIVFSEDQKVTAGGDWTTEISGKMIILPDPNNKITVNGISTATTTDADILLIPATVAVDSATGVLAEGQGRVTDIVDATAGEAVFLKKMADNSLSEIEGTGPRQGQATLGSVNLEEIPEGGVTWEGKFIGRKHGFASIRATPEVDNGTFDNFRGMIECWTNGGILLGFIKASGGNFDPATGQIQEDADSGIHAETIKDGRFRILPSRFGNYFDLDTVDLPENTVVTFIPNKVDGQLTKTINGEQYYVITKNPKGAEEITMHTFAINEESNEKTPVKVLATDRTTERYIKVSDATNIQSLWYNIQFDPSVDALFFHEWAREKKGGLFGEVKNVIDPTGANGADSINFDRSGRKLSEYSKTNDCWMSYTTLAATQESAIGPIINEDSNPEHPETTPENSDLTFVENYRGIEIYQNEINGFEITERIIIEGSIGIDPGESFALQDLKTLIDRSLE